MSTRHPQAGDGIVDAVGRRWIVDGLITRSGTSIVIGVTANRRGAREDFYNGECRRETFGEYLTRPTGLGRWSWWLVAPLVLGSAYGLFIGISTWHDVGWLAVVFIAVLWAVIIWMAHRNYTGKTR